MKLRMLLVNLSISNAFKDANDEPLALSPEQAVANERENRRCARYEEVVPGVWFRTGEPDWQWMEAERHVCNSRGRAIR
jgi:hypothetical protein